MARENKSRYAVLGALSMRPMSGYDIKKTFEQSIGNFWSESYGQIYPILRSLVAEGLATSRVEAQPGRPERRVYALTEAGREELRSWLSRPVDYEVGRVEILLKLFFGWQVPPTDNARLVEEWRSLHRQLLEKYDEIERWLRSAYSGEPGFPYWLMTVSYGRHVSRALIEWSDEALATLHGMTWNAEASKHDGEG